MNSQGLEGMEEAEEHWEEFSVQGTWFGTSSDAGHIKAQCATEAEFSQTRSLHEACLSLLRELHPTLTITYRYRM
jgi:hypothetical protein